MDGSDLLSFVFNYPNLSLVVAGIWLFGYVLLTVLLREKESWNKLSNIERVLAAAGVGMAVDFFVMIPITIVEFLWIGVHPLDFNTSYQVGGVILLFLVPLVLGVRRFIRPGTILIELKALLVGVSYISLITFLFFAAIGVISLTFPNYVTVVTDPLLTNSLSFAAESLLLALIGWAVLDFYLISPATGGWETKIPTKKQFYNLVPAKRALTVAIIAMLVVTVLGVPLNQIYGLWTPTMKETEENFRMYPGEPYNTSVLSIISYDDYTLKVSYYQVASRTYEVFLPALWSYPILHPVTSLAIENPSNWSKNLVQYLSGELTESGIWFGVPDNVSLVGVPNNNSLTEALLDFSEYQGPRNVQINVSYVQSFNERMVTVGAYHNATDVGGGLQLEAYTFNITNNEETTLVIDKIQLLRFRNTVVNQTTLQVFRNGVLQQNIFYDSLYIYTMTFIGPNQSAVMVVAFNSRSAS